MGWFDTLLYPIKVAIAWLMWAMHEVLVFLGFPDKAGIAWVLAIILMTIVIRSIIIPLYFKQIMAQRNTQLLQPEMKKIQQKYKGRKDRVSQEQQSQEIMALYKKYHANPLSSCWPMIVQIPIFFALFRVLASTPQIAAGTYHYKALGPLTKNIAQQIEDSTFLSAPLSSSFATAWGAGNKKVAIICLVLVVLMSLMMFLTQRMMMTKNMPKSDGNDQQMRMMRMMTYTMPIIMGVTGVAFQVGVLLYWLTSNIFMYGQQMYTLRKMPAPGSEAHRKMIERNNKKYQEFRKEREAELRKTLEHIGVDEDSVAAAHKAVKEAELAGHDNPREVLKEKNLPGVRQGSDPDKLWEGVQAHQIHHEKLRERRVKLQLEDKNEKKRKEEAAKAAINNQVRVQPQRQTRAERQRTAAKQREAQQRQRAKKSKQSRAQRRAAVENKSGKQGKKNS